MLKNNRGTHEVTTRIIDECLVAGTLVLAKVIGKILLRLVLRR